ncbi:hypothetical protein B0A55_00287 [Friedmanniomyces simplex]|uniref:HD/PDEase domain-containing protein n=1 Tax=Friedmanniomyces simplex TaxID=329884 RepID=A0A4U0Y559_9PEZI|nr:hypothetical protein B0A55_00287 [Friedmanniomyces simplex]
MCPPSPDLTAWQTADTRSSTDGGTIPDCVPADSLSQSAYDYASKNLHPAILAHSLRVWLFAKALAQRENSDYSTSDQLRLLFAACIYHDTGTCSAQNGSQRFEVEGGDAATQALLAHGVSERDAHEVWVAIALHTSPGIAERISPLARLIRVAVTVDFKRLAAMRFTTEGEVEAIEAMFPRGEIEKVLGDAVVDQVLGKDNAEASDAKAPAATWAGVMVRSKRENPDARRQQQIRVPTLLGLPPELRYRIWELCIASTASTTNSKQGKDTVILAQGRRTSEVQHAVQQPPLTRVCRQMRSEALPMFYNGKAFVWRRFDRSFGVDPYARHVGYHGDCAVVRWVTAIGEQNCGWLRSVVLQYEAVDLMKKREAEAEVKTVVGSEGVVSSECLQTAEEYWWQIGVGC